MSDAVNHSPHVVDEWTTVPTKSELKQLHTRAKQQQQKQKAANRHQRRGRFDQNGTTGDMHMDRRTHRLHQQGPPSLPAIPQVTIRKLVKLNQSTITTLELSRMTVPTVNDTNTKIDIGTTAFSALPVHIVHSNAQIIFMDGLRLILQFLNVYDFAATRVFRVCRHWWRSITSMKSIGFMEWIIKVFDATKHMYPPTILESSSLRHHCKSVELHWNCSLINVRSALNQLSSYCPGIEVLSIVAYDHSYEPQLLRQVLKFRLLKSLKISCHSIQPLLNAQLRLPQTLTRIEWVPNTTITMCTAFGLPPQGVSHAKVPISILPHVREFRYWGTVDFDSMEQYIRYLPNLTSLDVNGITNDCLTILSQFQRLRQLYLCPVDTDGPLTSKLLYHSRQVFTHLHTLELALVDYTFEVDPEEALHWQLFLSSLPELAHLLLTDTPVDSLSHLFPLLHHAPKLTTLTLNPLWEPTYEFLTPLGSCQQLIELNLCTEGSGTPLILETNQTRFIRPEVVGHTLWPNLERVYLDYTRYQFQQLGSSTTNDAAKSSNKEETNSIAIKKDESSAGALTADTADDQIGGLRNSIMTGPVQATGKVNDYAVGGDSTTPDVNTPNEDDEGWVESTSQRNNKRKKKQQKRHLIQATAMTTARIPNDLDLDPIPTMSEEDTISSYHNIPEPFTSPLWHAVSLAQSNMKEARRCLRARALVDQNICIMDDEWFRLAETNNQPGLRLLAEFHYQPQVLANKGAILHAVSSSRESVAEAIALTRCLLEVTDSFGRKYAHAIAECCLADAFVEAHHQWEAMIRRNEERTNSRSTEPLEDASQFHALTELIQHWDKKHTGLNLQLMRGLKKTTHGRSQSPPPFVYETASFPSL